VLHPDFPVVSGDYQLTENWRLVLPDRFNRRFEDDSLVLWRPQLTFWAIAWNNDHEKTMEATLATTLAAASPHRREEQIERTSSLIRLTYELPEEDLSRTPAEYTSISAYVISRTGHLQLSAYFDSPVARTMAYQVIHSVQCSA
jgi:hypothetical protein